MTTSNFPTETTGWIAIAAGISAILAVIFLALMFSGASSFGTLNDVMNGVTGILSALLAGMLYAGHHVRSPLVSQVALALALVGVVFVIIGSVLVIFGCTGFVLAGWYSSLGFALIGLWLVLFCYSLLRGGVFPHGLIVYGLVVGGFMAFGLFAIPGIFAKIDSMQSMPWVLNVAFMGWLGTYILLPIWMILFGRMLLLK